MSDLSEVIFCNGKFISNNNPSVKADDRGFMFGDGLFETILSYNYELPFFEQHFVRLFHSAQKLKINLPSNYNKENLRTLIQNLLDQNNIKPNTWQGIKIILTRGSGPRSLEPLDSYPYKSNLLISCFHAQKPSLNSKSLAVSCYKTNHHSILPNLKTLNYLDKILAKQQVLENNYDDCLLINTDNHICECSTSNIFFITKQNEIITPQISDGVLPGVTRNFVIMILKEIINNINRDINIGLNKKLSYKFSERSIDIKTVIPTNKYDDNNINSAFITNSIMGINTISKIGDINFEQNNIINLIYNKFLAAFS